MLWTVVKEAAENWSSHKDSRQGAALAYYSVFSLGPVIVIDYTHHTPHPIANNEMWTYEPYDALILAVRDCALSAAKLKPDQTAAIVSSLYGRGPRIFKRLALHVLSRQPDAAPALCATYLTDTSLIGEGWCEDEYAELALKNHRRRRCKWRRPGLALGVHDRGQCLVICRARKARR